MNAKYQEKMLRKLERSGVIKRFPHEEPKWEKPRPRVLMLVPSYKGPHPLMQEATGAMIEFSRPYAEVFSPPRHQSCVVHWSRNQMLAEVKAVSEPFDYALYIDDDMVPQPDALVKLLSHQQHIVAGLATRRVDPPLPNMLWLEKSMEFSPILKWKNVKDIMQVDAAGTGMMLISREAIEAVGEFYLRCGYERQMFGRMFNKAVDCAITSEVMVKFSGFKNEVETGCASALVESISDHFEKQLGFMEAERREAYRRTGDAHWFQFLPKLNHHGEYGEDVSFCLKAKLCGIDVFTDTTVRPGHIGDYVYSINDFFAYQDALVQAAAPQPKVLVTE